MEVGQGAQRYLWLQAAERGANAEQEHPEDRAYRFDLCFDSASRSAAEPLTERAFLTPVGAVNQLV